jgi:uncharacterized membrane protein HdeD (DUF308 family)
MNNNQETDSENKLTEFEDEKPKPKGRNPAIQVLIGLFFIGYGIFRLSSTARGDGSWNTLYGSIMIISGVIYIAAAALKK